MHMYNWITLLTPETNTTLLISKRHGILESESVLEGVGEK